MKHFRTTLPLLCLLFSASSIWGQVATGSLGGTIIDANRAVVPGAIVTAKNEATGVEFKTQSSDAGLYVFATLQTGPYAVTVEKVGFKKAHQGGLEIRIATRLDLDVRMELGEVQQTVEVTGEAPLLETSKVERGQNLSVQFVNNLPFYFGGIRSPRAFVGYMQGANSGAELSVQGSNGRSQEVLIDGASFTIPESGGTSFNPPAAEMFDEFKMLTSFDAEYGRAGGGIELYHSKSGTNDLHGTAFLNMRRDIWNANAWANNANGRIRPKERTNETGGAAGGPIWIPKVYNGRNKSFFYFTFTQIVQPASVSQQLGTVPTARMKQGDFSELPAAQVIYDPQTTAGNIRSPFPGQVIPQNRFSTISSQLLSSIPNPTRSALLGNYDYVGTGNPNIVSDPIWSLKFDHSITNNHRVAFFFSKDNQLSDVLAAFDGPLGQGLKTYQRPDNWRINYDWIAKPNVLVHFTYGYSRTRQFWDNPQQKGAASKFGFPGITGNSDAMPRVQFNGADGYTPWGVQDGKVANGSQLNSTKMYTAAINWVRGKHELKGGFDLRWLGTYSDPLDLAGTNGQYFFSRAQTALPTNLTGTGNAFASLLLGAVDSANRVALPVVAGFIRYQYYAGYVQDNWRITPKLTLTLGMRYEVPRNWMARNGDYSGLDLSRPNPGAGNRNGALVFYGSGAGREGVERPYATDFTDFGPHLGFAYRLDQKTVIRGGFSIVYQALGNGGCGCRVGFANPIVQNSDGVNPVLNWDSGIAPPVGFRPPPTIDPTVANNTDADYFSKRFGKAPRIPNWSFNIQREIHKYIIEAGYVGNRGRYLNSTTDLNQLPTDRLALGALLQRPIDAPEVVAAGFTKPYPTFTGTLAQALRPYPQYFNVSERNSGVGRTWYDSLQVKGERRFGDFQLSATYVWSKSLALDTYRQIFSQTQTYPQDAYNQLENKSYSFFDQPHVLNLLWSWNLPLGRGKKFLGSGGRALDWVVGGWTISGIQQYRSSGLIQVTAPNTLGNGVIFSRYKKANIGSGPIRTGVDIGTLDPNNPNVRWFNAAAFTIPGQYELGNSAMFYGDFRNPYIRNEQLSIVKRTNFRYRGERGVILTYRADIYNLFNRTAFGGVNGTIGNVNFGRVTGPQIGARVITMGLRLNF
jgi:hypothetical protein